MSDETNKEETGKGALAGAFAPQAATPQQPGQPAGPLSLDPAIPGPSPENRARQEAAMISATKARLGVTYVGGEFIACIQHVPKHTQTRQQQRRGPER